MEENSVEAMREKMKGYLAAVAKLPAGERFELLEGLARETRLNVTIRLEQRDGEFVEHIDLRGETEKSVVNELLERALSAEMMVETLVKQLLWAKHWIDLAITKRVDPACLPDSTPISEALGTYLEWKR
jgi:hypothetical protein